MKAKYLKVEVLETTADKVLLRLPNVEVPVQMSRTYFDPRLKAGYFRIDDKTNYDSRNEWFDPSVLYEDGSPFANY